MQKIRSRVDSNAADEVDVVIVTHNSYATIEACLDSLTGGWPSRIIVVDSGSTDNTLQILKRRPDVEVLVRPNIGYAPAVNLALQCGQAKYVMLINPDATLTENALDELVKALEMRNDLGIVAPVLVEGSVPSLDASARQFPTALEMLKRLTGIHWLSRSFQHNVTELTSGIVEVPASSGAVMLVRRTLLEQHGGLDTALPMYLEDLDLFARVHRRGLSVGLVLHASATHVGGHSTVQSPHRQMLEVVEDAHAPYLFIRRYHGRFAAYRFTIAVLVGALVRLAVLRAVPRRLATLRGAQLSDRREMAANLFHWAATDKQLVTRQVNDMFSSADSPKAPTVSILVHNLNRATDLERCLDSVVEQRYPNLEIIVADAGSTDGSLEVIDRIRASQPDGSDFLNRLDVPLTGVAESRNRLAKSASGEILVFLDNDAVFTSPYAIKRIVDGFASSEHSLALVSFRILLRDTDDLDPYAWVFRRPKSHSLEAFDTFTFAGGGCAIRSADFRRAEGYWETLQYSREEEDLAFELLDRGGRLRYDPSVTIRHFPNQANRLSLAERRRTELRNGTLVLWRRLPMPAAAILIMARFASSLLRATRERHDLAPMLGGIRDAFIAWKSQDLKRRPIRWITLIRYFRLHGARA